MHKYRTSIGPIASPSRLSRSAQHSPRLQKCASFSERRDLNVSPQQFFESSSQISSPNAQNDSNNLTPPTRPPIDIGDVDSLPISARIITHLNFRKTVDHRNEATLAVPGIWKLTPCQSYRCFSVFPVDELNVFGAFLRQSNTLIHAAKEL